MTHQIWKFPITFDQDLRIEMPSGASLLRVDQQGFQAALWAIVNPQNQKVIRHFRILGTGYQFDPGGLVYVGTWQDPPFVWHLFEVING